MRPLATYTVQLEVEIATDVPRGCGGIGGAPGESVFLKAGATRVEPVTGIDAHNYVVLLNVDKGNQSTSGREVVVLGTIENSVPCQILNGQLIRQWELKTLRTSNVGPVVQADDQGGAWLIAGTDSGFEGTTSIYYTRVAAMFTQQSRTFCDRTSIVPVVESTRMNASALGLLGLLAAQSAALPKFVVPAVPDVTIKTRRTTDHQESSISTTIVYRKGARQRTETIVDWPQQVSAVTGSKRTHIGTSIIQCDERRTVVLNDEAKTYAYSPIEDPSVYLQRARLVARRHPQPEPTGGDVTITIDAVDTGEQRTMGRYIARRVITTTKTDPGPGTSVPASERTQDGWYIDLPSANCWDRGDQPEPFAFTIVQRSNAPRDRVHIKGLGTTRRGYPIEETNRSKDERGTTTSKLELIEFSDAPLDAALFTVPAGYRPALPNLFGGYDLTKPDTVMNRLQSYWDGLRAWADGRLRFVWRQRARGSRIEDSHHPVAGPQSPI